MDFDNPKRCLLMSQYHRKGHTEEDMISHLPDAIIVFILSLMPTRYSIRTSVLSRRWEHLWTFSPKLDFEMQLPFSDKDRYEDERMQLSADTFTHSVNKLFHIRGKSSMESFRVSCWAVIDRSLPNMWIHNVLMCKNLTELIVGIEDTVRLGELPDSLFTCNTLVVVRISGRFTLNLPYCARLPSLKTLSLNDVRQFSDTSIQNLLSGCPILEDFKLIRNIADYALVIDVCLSSLRRLTLGLGGYIYIFKSEYFLHKVKVEAPKLEFIDVRNFYVDSVCLDISLHSIVEASFDICPSEGSHEDEIVYRNQAVVLLMKFVNITSLALSQTSCQIFFCANATKLPMFSNLIRLELDFNLEDGPQLLMDMLDSYPKLEDLILLQEIDSSRDIEDDSHFNNWTPPVQVPECLLHSLKSVFLQEYGGQPEEIGTVAYLLKNALILENITIFCRKSVDSEKLVELDRSLAAYPKVSTGCQVKLYPDTGEGYFSISSSLARV